MADNTIAAQVQVPQAGGNTLNPISMLEHLSNLQNRMNQNKLFQQEFAAKQRAGEIFATASDPEAALQAIMKDPIAAPFAPALVSNIRQGNLALTQMQGEQQAQAKTGLEAVLKSMPEVMADPTPERFDKIMAGRLEALSPDARKRVASVLPSIRSSLFNELPEDGDAAARADLIRRRGVGLVLGAGFGSEAVNNLVSGGLPAQISEKSVGPGGQKTYTVLGGANGLGGMAGGKPVVGPTIEEAKVAEGLGANAGELQTEYSTLARGMPDAVKRVDMMTNALSQFQAGGGADIRGDLGKFMQALKNAGVSSVSDKMIADVANGSLDAGQVFDAQVKPLVVAQLKDAAQGTGRVMKSEVDAFMAMMDKTTDPKALLELLNQARYKLQVGYDQSQKFLEFKQGIAKKDPAFAGLHMADFPIWYAKNFDPTKLPELNAGKGMRLAPNVPGDFKGTGAAGTVPTRRYVPGKGFVDIKPE